MPAGWPLTGRVEELRRISKLIRRRDGPAGVVLAGATGVGKTRLAREVLSAEQRGALTRWARPRRGRCRWVRSLSQEKTAALVEARLSGPVDSVAARRLWSVTQGNALYLRHLVDGELDARRLRQVSRG